jgi:hypothetical protein
LSSVICFADTTCLTDASCREADAAQRKQVFKRKVWAEKKKRPHRSRREDKAKPESCPNHRCADVTEHLSHGVASSQDADDNHHPTPGKKPEVPEEPLPARNGFVDVVQAEHLVVDNAFDKVERSEADEHRRDEVSRRPAEMAEAAGPPQDEEAGSTKT